MYHNQKKKFFTDSSQLLEIYLVISAWTHALNMRISKMNVSLKCLWLYAHKKESITEAGHSSNTYAKIFEKLTFLPYMCVSRGKKYSQNFAYVLNRWSQVYI